MAFVARQYHYPVLSALFLYLTSLSRALASGQSFVSSSYAISDTGLATPDASGGLSRPDARLSGGPSYHSTLAYILLFSA